jgi:uncharacterized protein
MAHVTLLALGDMHGSILWTPALQQAAKEAHAVLLLGDLTNFGTTEDAGDILQSVYKFCTAVWSIAGNCDSAPIEQMLIEQGISLHARGIVMENRLGICGVSGSNPTPFGTPLEYSESDLTRYLEKGWEQIREAPVRVILHHAPPWNTTCDRIGPGVHVGVKGLRTFCERHQPDLVLCGHIHEARGRDRIGGTMIINAGPASRGYGVRIRLFSDGMQTELLDPASPAAST